jgi:transposase
MESTGIYWVPLFEILESRGFTVCLVNARPAKNLPGRKTDLKDCPWLQKLHSCGLLNKSFRPAADIVTLRRYLRHRESLVAEAGTCVQRRQKALTEMNVQLANVISDLSGLTGMRMIRAVLEGERDGHRLAALRDGRIRASEQEMAASLEGNWRDELLFVLAQNVAAYEFYQRQLAECDQRIQTHFQSLATKVDPAVEPPPARRKAKRAQGNAPAFNLRTELYRLTGTDLTQIDGIDVVTAQAILAEIGTDRSAWPTEKHFASWLGLCPDHRISGGKVLRRGTRQVVNPAATALR